MDLETTKMSSRGQIVIPQHVREEMDVDEGSIFAIFHINDAIVLKKIETPSKEALLKDLRAIAVEGRAKLEAKSIKESDIPVIVHKTRRK